MKIAQPLKIVDKGIAPCTQCGKPHVCYDTEDGFESWENDGHPYRQMSQSDFIEVLLNENKVLKDQVLRLKNKRGEIKT